MAQNERLGNIIVDLHPNDVLLGRGSGPNDHEGNKRFRAMVAERKTEYMATNHRLTKAKIAQGIVNGVYAMNGRFLRKLEGDEASKYRIPDGIDAYVLATEATIMEKAKQALRQNASKLKNDRSLSPIQAQQRNFINGNGFDSSRIPTKFAHPIVISAPFNDDFEPIPISSSTGFSQMENTQVHSNSTSLACSDPNPNSTSIASHADVLPWKRDDVNFSNQSQVPNVILQQSQQFTQQNTHQRSAPQMRRQNSISPEPTRAQPRHVSRTFPRRNSSDQSFSQIPIDDYTDRRGSITIGELATLDGRRRYMQRSDDQMMSGLIDSFNQMKATKEEQKKQFSSTETMGTIEPIGMDGVAGLGSVADMSMGSSIFSFYGASRTSDFGGGLAGTGNNIAQDDQRTENTFGVVNVPNISADRQLQQHQEAAQNRYSGMRFGSSEISDFPSFRNKTGRQGSMFTVGNSIDEGVELAGNLDFNDLNERFSAAHHLPTPASLLDHSDNFTIGTLGQSSMSVLKAFVSQNEFDGFSDSKK